MMRLTGLLLTIAVAAATQAAPSFAEISRGCSAQITVTVPGRGVFNVMDLDASGLCLGFQPNQCRVLASGALQNCMDDLWRSRNDHAIPASCTPAYDHFGGDARINWTQFSGIYANLPVSQDSMIDRVRTHACCWPGEVGEVTVSVIWETSGDNGCAGDPFSNASRASRPLDASYTLDCYNQRLRGLCGAIPQRANPGE